MALRAVVSILLFGILIFNTSFLNTNTVDVSEKDKEPPFLSTGTAWVDSVFNSLTVNEKIAQLFMIAAYSNKDKASGHVDEITRLIEDYKIGGLIFMQGGPVRQAKLTNYYQSISKTPLLMAIDGEWGVSMRLDSTIRYPRQMMLGAIEDDRLIYQMGEQVALECKRLGIHVNFAPVIDINNNPANPVIGSRSFGEDKYNVVDKGYAYMSGMQDNNVLAVGKHFPGHGDTDIDSHKALPTINHSLARLNTIELYPFKQLIKKGLGGMMVAHLYIPVLDSTENTATTLSKKVVTDLLKNEMGFKGVIFTDALNMKGVANYFKPGEVDAKALIAGNDILLFSSDVHVAINRIKQAMGKGEITIEEIDSRCRKILELKYWVGLNKKPHVEIERLYEDLNSPQAKLLKQKLVENAITVVKNEDELLPFMKLDTLSVASVAIGVNTVNKFQKTLAQYTDVKHFNISKKTPNGKAEAIIKEASNYDVVIVSVHNTNRRPSSNYGVNAVAIRLVDRLAECTNVVLDVFANPYCLKNFKNLEKVKGIIVSYNDEAITNRLSAQMLFGGIPAKGKLPVTATENLKAGKGIKLSDKIRLKYSLPEDVGLNSADLYKVDSIALDAIEKGATPGCQVLLAKDGVVFYQKAFGHHTYAKDKMVTNADIYDIASITKIVSTTAALMKLYEDKKYDLNDPISKYLTYLDTSSKKDIIIKEVLSHQACLKPWIPFYLKTLNGEDLNPEIYRTTCSDTFCIQVANDLFIRNDYRDSIFYRILESEQRCKKEYKYSDLGYYLFMDLIEKLSGDSLQNYVRNNFYNPIGAYTMGYKPLERFPLSRLIPTENDKVFRKQLIHGYVHDPGASMLGGVCGHAGVFSNANDLAKMMQMFLQEGEYGGVRYFKPQTIKYFTSCPFCKKKNRRGIGFDKPEMNYNKPGPTCQCISAKSFGHTGFTGTIAWADPETQIVYVFLSNRIHPDAGNKLLVKMDVRIKIQEALYEAFSNGHAKHS